MRLDPSHFCYLTNTEFRVLTAIEIGMRNHQYIPLSLITTTANLRSVGMSGVISSLLKAKLIVHCGKVYDGYKLTFLGLDYLALRALSKRGVIASVGRRIGVGKEADVHLCKDTADNLVVLKFHRLGRISFRSVKNNRDYMGNRKHASWMYLSQLAAKKEFSYLSSLHEEAFPVPEPIDFNRHVIAMRFVDGIPLSQVREIGSPMRVLHTLMGLIVRLARLGVIHGDFNEFNLMINEEGDSVTVISVYHENAQFYFDRDVKSVVELFKRKFKVDVVESPSFHDVVRTVDESKVRKLRVDISALDNEFLNDVFQNLRREVGPPAHRFQGAEGGLEPDEIAQDMEGLKLDREYYELRGPEDPGDLAGDSDDTGPEDAVLEGEEVDRKEGLPWLANSEGGDLEGEDLEGSDVEEGLEEDEEDEDEDLGDDDDEEEEEEEDGGKPKHIQIWKPHVKRVGNRAYGRRLNARARNKSKAESKKDRKQRKIRESINSIKDAW